MKIKGPSLLADIKELLLTDNAYMDHKPAILLTGIKQKQNTQQAGKYLEKDKSLTYCMYILYFDTWKGGGGEMNQREG